MAGSLRGDASVASSISASTFLLRCLSSPPLNVLARRTPSQPSAPLSKTTRGQSCNMNPLLWVSSKNIKNPLMSAASSVKYAGSFFVTLFLDGAEGLRGYEACCVGYCVAWVDVSFGCWEGVEGMEKAENAH